MNDRRTAEYLKQRIYHQTCAKERRYFVDVARKPRNEKIVPVLVTGAQGTCGGSRLKGHARRGGRWMRDRHKRYVPVAKKQCSRRDFSFQI